MDKELVITDEHELCEKIKELYKTVYIKHHKGQAAYDLFGEALAEYILDKYDSD